MFAILYHAVVAREAVSEQIESGIVSQAAETRDWDNEINVENQGVGLTSS